MEVEERQQGEGESSSETSENMGGVGGHGMLSPHHFNMKEEEGEESVEEEEEGGGDEELTSTYRPAGQSECALLNTCSWATEEMAKC